MQPCASPRVAAVPATLAFILLLAAPAVVWAQTSIYQFDPSNNLLGTIIAPGLVTAMTYDSQTDNLVVDSDSHGAYTRYYYNAAGNITQTFAEPGPVTAMTYDAELNEIITGGGDTLDEYDSSNNLVESIPEPDPIEEIIDESNGTLVATLMTSSPAQSSLAQVGNSVSGQNYVLHGVVTSATLDGVGGAIIAATNVGGQNTLTVYSSTGQSLESIDTLGTITAMTYDPVSREFGIGQTNSNTGLSSWIDSIAQMQTNGAQSLLLPLTLIGGQPLTGVPTTSTWDSQNNSFYVATITPESKSIVLIAPGLLLLAALGFRRTIKKNFGEDAPRREFDAPGI